MRKTLASSIILAVALAAGCGGEDQPSNDGGNPNTGRYLPMKTGATWTYRITDPDTGATGDKISTVGDLEDVGGLKAGQMAFRVTTEKLDGTTVSWQEDTGTSVVRHKEQSFDTAQVMTSEEHYDPSKLRLDESPAHLEDGATWVDSYMELITGAPAPVQKNETWIVEAVGEEVTVPAGTFTTLRVRRTGAVGAADKTYWFARGVGKVREAGGQTEELVSYDIPE
jgi:hypothetical protein